MVNVQTKAFGLIELDESKSLFMRRNLTVNGRSGSCSLYVGEGICAQPTLLAQGFRPLEDLDGLDDRARSAFLEDGLSSEVGIVAGFVQCHLEELDDEVVEALFGDLEPGSRSVAALLPRLGLSGIGIHLEKDGGPTVHLDYSFNLKLSDELLVARFEGLELRLILAHES
jgi:Protein of unknown function (DUF2004)